MLATIKVYFFKGNYLPFLIGLLSGLYFISFKVVGYSFEYFPGDFIDARFNNYILEHAYQFFTFQISDYWNAPFMFPEKDVISYSDNLLGTAPFYAIFRGIGFDRETSFQLWYLLITCLNYLSTYILINYVFKNKYAATIGAIIFTFSLALQSQMGHAQTFARFPMIICVLSALKFSEEQNLKWFFWTIFSVVYQLYCGIYLGLLLLLSAFVLVLSIFIFKRHSILMKIQQRKWLWSLIGIIIFNACLLLPLILPYIERARQLGFYDYKQVVFSILTPLSYFFSWNGSLFWDGLRETCISYPAFWDHTIFSGALATIGILFFIFILPFYIFKKENKNLPFKLLWITAILTFLFFIRIERFSFYKILFHLPGYGSMRALQRIINFELLFFALGLAFLVDYLTKKKKWIAITIFIILNIAAIADNYVRDGFIHQRSKIESQGRINLLVERIKFLPKQSILSYEPDSLLSQSSDYHLDAMLASQQVGLKCLNGYSATSPGGYGNYWEKPNAEGRTIWLNRKNQDTTNIVVIH